MKNLNIKDEYFDIHKTNISAEQLDIIDGYAAISLRVNTDKGECYLSGVIDDKLNTVVPFRYESYDEKLIQEELNGFVPIFDNDVGIYMADDENIFVIDLKNAVFKRDKKINKLLPITYIRKIDAYERVSHDMVNILLNGMFYTYKPSEDRIISMPYDYIDRIEDTVQSIGYVCIDMLGSKPIYVACIIKKDGTPGNPCIIDEDIEASFSDDILNNREELIKCSLELYNSICYSDSSLGNKLCKILQ